MGQTASVFTLLNNNNKNIPQNNLIIQLHLQNFEKISSLIEQKLKEPNFNINKPINKMNDTILHYAAFKRDKTLIQYLLQKGASSDVKNSRGLTPIDVTEDNDIKKILIQKK